MSKAEMSERLTKAAMGIEPGLPLETSGGDLDALQRDVQRLFDIEAIKQLKHAYFRCIDTANFDELETLFHPEISVHFVGGFYEWRCEGREEFMANQRKSFHKRAVGHHNGHQPEIQIQSEREATGLWYLADHMWILEHQFYTTGTALYADRYVKEDGRWWIRETKYRRIYEISRSLEENPPFSAHYLANEGSEPATD